MASSQVREDDANSLPSIAPLPARQSLSSDVYEAVKRLVMDGVIPPGERLGIDQLARDLHVSSTPIREALVRLESEGLAEKVALRGYRTTETLTSEQIGELYEFRELIEPWAASHAARRCGEAGEKALYAEVHSIDNVAPGSSYESYRELVLHDARFHQLIAELAGNRQILSAFVRTNCHLHLFRTRYTSGAADLTLREHLPIAEAIVAGRAADARAAMRKHLRQARQRYGG